MGATGGEAERNTVRARLAASASPEALERRVVAEVLGAGVEADVEASFLSLLSTQPGLVDATLLRLATGPDDTSYLQGGDVDRGKRPGPTTDGGILA